ncbi:Terpenoid cyclases/Protein prenyltransferases superfamily protein [Euphorbia peplus]|nr:Terpenoid cyclases/Protein prenyltransferases superfamily protein [Euphorbia peplus]
MVVFTSTIPAYKFGLNAAFWVKSLPHVIRLPNKLHYYHSEKSNKIRANMEDHVQSPATPEKDIVHGSLKNYKSSHWGETFISLAPNDKELKSHSEEVKQMKVKVKNMLLHSTKNLTDNVEFINLLCRLGISYHFEDEIEEQLNHIFTMLPKLLEDNDYELCTLANLFRVLRQYGHKMTSDVFEKFRDVDGEFKEDITSDVKGILCLYEACFLAIHGEDILDDALAFTTKHLEILAENSSPHLQDYIMKSLTYPSHHTIERLDAFNNISFYEEDEYVDATLLKFAKLDYNRLQLLYRKELALLSRWWSDFNIAENFPYSRDRLVESYTWVIGIIFEPQYSICRIIICKYMAVLTILDDTYDLYGTIDEIRHFTTAIQRFTADATDELPEYMKRLYRQICQLFEKDNPQGCNYKTTFVKEMISEIAVAYYEEAIWLRERKTPSFDEYMRISTVSCGCNILSSLFILGAEDMGMNEILWVKSDPEIVVNAKLHVRYKNDISGLRKTNAIRGEFPKAVDCYMIEHGVSQAEAIEALLETLESKWKVMNEDLLRPNIVPRILLKHIFNYARSSDIFFTDQSGDLFTNYGNILKPIVKSLIIDPLPL